MSCSAAENSKMAIASRKLAAAEQRRARKAAREPRSRLNSDSMTDKMPLMQAPKGILKNSHQNHRIPTKRSVSECVDDLTQIMADLNLSFTAAEFRSQLPQLFDEKEEDDDDDEYDEDEDKEGCEACFNQNKDSQDMIGLQQHNHQHNNLKKCDCNNSNPTFSDSNDKKPKKSVRFNEQVYETFFFASRLYDRRQMAKYHFSSRHHPPSNQQQHHNQTKQSKKARQRSESESHETTTGMSMSTLKSDNPNNQCKLSKSQRAKQSKKDKKKNSHKKEDSNDTSSDDQGYSSSHHSISD